MGYLLKLATDNRGQKMEKRCRLRVAVPQLNKISLLHCKPQQTGRTHQEQLQMHLHPVTHHPYHLF